MTQTVIKELRLCAERDNLVNLLKEVGKQANVNKVISDLSNKYPSSPSVVLRYLTRLKNMAAEQIESMKDQPGVPYLESAQFRKDLAEEFNGYNKVPYSANTSFSVL